MTQPMLPKRHSHRGHPLASQRRWMRTAVASQKEYRDGYVAATPALVVKSHQARQAGLEISARGEVATAQALIEARSQDGSAHRLARCRGSYLSGQACGLLTFDRNARTWQTQ